VQLAASKYLRRVKSIVFRKSLKEVTEEKKNKRMDSRELLSLARASEDDKR
jgi:hypothetical protein